VQGKGGYNGQIGRKMENRSFEVLTGGPGKDKRGACSDTLMSGRSYFRSKFKTEMNTRG
jgi:hypothetical protein